MNELRLLYTRRQAKTGSFWYYFFQMCGVWCERVIVEKGEQFEDKILRNQINIVVQDVAEVCEYPEDSFAEVYIFPDTLKIETEEDAKAYKRDLIEVLQDFIALRKKREEIDSSELKTLLRIYIKNGLWYILWEYRETAWREDRFARRRLQKAIESGRRKLTEKTESPGRYFGYAKCYLDFTSEDLNNQYIRIKKNGKLVDETYDAEKRNGKAIKCLSECIEFGKQFPGIGALEMLSGAICEFGVRNYSFALLYYSEAAGICGNPMLYYHVGKKFDSENGNKRISRQYYDAAREGNPWDIRIKYKFAEQSESLNDRKNALKAYRKLLSAIEHGIKNGAAELQEIEYALKISKRIKTICYEDYYGEGIKECEDLCRKVVDTASQDEYLQYISKRSEMDGNLKIYLEKKFDALLEKKYVTVPSGYSLREKSEVVAVFV